MPKKETNQNNEEKRGFLSRLFGGLKGSSCCDVKIVPKEELEELQKDERFVGKKDKEEQEK